MSVFLSRFIKDVATIERKKRNMAEPVYVGSKININNLRETLI